jgi:hypothetical protein
MTLVKSLYNSLFPGIEKHIIIKQSQVSMKRLKKTKTSVINVPGIEKHIIIKQSQVSMKRLKKTKTSVINVS